MPSYSTERGLKCESISCNLQLVNNDRLLSELSVLRGKYNGAVFDLQKAKTAINSFETEMKCLKDEIAKNDGLLLASDAEKKSLLQQMKKSTDELNDTHEINLLYIFQPCAENIPIPVKIEKIPTLGVIFKIPVSYLSTVKFDVFVFEQPQKLSPSVLTSYRCLLRIIYE